MAKLYVELLENCTSEPKDSGVIVRDTITITADDGYYFNPERDIALTHSDWGMDTEVYMNEVVLSEDDTVMTVTLYGDVYDLICKADKGDAKVETVTVTYGVMENCTFNFADGEEVEKRTKADLIFTADEGYSFVEGETEVCRDSEYGEMCFRPNELTGWGTNKLVKSDWAFMVDFENVSCNAIEEVPEEVPEEEGNVSYENVKNCTVNYADGDYVEGENTFIFTADEGYYFDNDIEYVGGFGTTIVVPIRQFGNAERTVVTVVIDGMAEDIIAVANKGLIDDDDDVDDVKTVLMFTDIFNPTDEELESLSKQRYSTSSGDSLEDLGNFINALYHYPFDVSDLLVTEDADTLKKAIVFGGVVSSIESRYFKNSKQNVDLGTIEVPEVYNSLYDYEGVETVLHVPLTNPIDLDTDKVVGYDVSIKYVVDLYNLECTIQVSSTFSNSIIYLDTFDIGQQIPFKNESIKYADTTTKTPIQYELSKSYIEIIRPIPIVLNDKFGRVTRESGKLENYDGYLEVTDLEFTSWANDIEKDEVKQLLNTGVYIKKIVD